MGFSPHGYPHWRPLGLPTKGEAIGNLGGLGVRRREMKPNTAVFQPRSRPGNSSGGESETEMGGLVIAAVECGWTVRNDLIWAKSYAAPDGAADRWRFSHEHVLFLTKRARGYKFNADEIRVPYSPVTERRWAKGQKYGGNKANAPSGPLGQRFKKGKTFKLNPKGTIPQDVLEYSTARSRLDHFATYPIGLIEKMLLATTDAGDLVLDPFAGTATTGLAAIRNGRRFVGIELNPDYVKIARSRLSSAVKASRLAA